MHIVQQRFSRFVKFEHAMVLGINEEETHLGKIN